MYGLIGGEANKIEPEKRMLSSMTPTIVEKNNKLFMTLGTPGGSTIITSVIQTILNVHEFKMGMNEAVNSPRFHHQWMPDSIRIESERFDNKIKNALIKSDQLSSMLRLSKTDLISLKNITFKAKNEFIVYLIKDAVIASVIT